jgi:hypothetical protein
MGPERGPIPTDSHAKSDRRARTMSRGDDRSPRAARHRDRTRAQTTRLVTEATLELDEATDLFDGR